MTTSFPCGEKLLRAAVATVVSATVTAAYSPLAIAQTQNQNRNQADLEE